MADLTQILPRLAKLLPLLGSDHPGEVAATAAAIGRLLASASASWHDLAGRLAAPTPSPAAEVFRWRWQHAGTPPPPGRGKQQRGPERPRAARHPGSRQFSRIWQALDYILATDNGLTAEEGERVQRLREQDYRHPHVPLAQADIAWLAMRWGFRMESTL